MVSISGVCRACKSFFTRKHHRSKRERNPPSPPSDPQPYDQDQDQITYIDRQRKAKEEKKHTNSLKNTTENEPSRNHGLLNNEPSRLSRSSSTTHSRNAPSFSRSRSQIQRSKSGPIGTLFKSMSRHHVDPEPPPSLSRSTSRTGHNPIMYSNSTGLIIPPDMEKQLECTLDELCFGCTKKITITRDVVKDNGEIAEEDEELTIKVKPGWTKGTKIKFEQKGNETPGTKAADLNLIIAEKKHHLFTREGDHDLRLEKEVTLEEALTDCTLSIPIVGGETTSLEIENIIFPGFEKVIEGQGMPVPKEKGKRGNLIVQFSVKFTEKLSEEKRLEIYRILEISFFSS